MDVPRISGTFHVPATAARNGLITIPVHITDGAHNTFVVNMEIEAK
jgi:hypothetical protein